MHIIWLTTQFPNGTENKNGMFIYRTVRELSKIYSVTVVVLHPVIPPVIPMLNNLSHAIKIYKEWKKRFPKNPKRPEGIESVNVIYSKFIRPPRLKDNFWEGWFAYKSVKKKFEKIISNNNKIILHATWLFPEGRAAYLLNKKFNFPYIVTLMGSDVNYLSVNTKKYEYAKKILNTSSMITSVSKALLATCIKKNLPVNKNKSALTHTVYETNKFVIKDKINIRNELRLNESQKIIFFAGALRKLKNVDKLILSVNELKINFNSIKLFIAGNGFEEGNLKKMIAEKKLEKNVTLLGNLNPDTLIKYYNAADVFVLPSKNEGLPNVIIEALLCGTPVVASNVGEIPYIIQEGENGFLVEPNSIESLTKNIRLILEKQWDRNFLRKSVDFLNTEKVIQEYRSVYDKIIQTN